MVQPIETKLKAIGYTISLQGGRPENQDAVRSRHTPLGTVIIVCDGMGGMQGGRIASEIAVNTILETIIRAEAQSNPKMTLIKAIRNANMAILQQGQMHAHLKGMGTTAAVLLLSEKSALVAYVGDTRIYQLRNHKKVYRTFDHSMVFEMVRKNVITEEQARLSAQSNIILRALGVKPDLEVETTELPYRKGDQFLLCSDGFWGCLPEKEFLRLLHGNKKTDRKLEEAALRIDQIGHQGGGEHDNLTAALITMNANSILKEKMNRTAKIMITALTALLVVSFGFNIYLTTGHPKAVAAGDTQDSIPTGNVEIPADPDPSDPSEPAQQTPEQPEKKAGDDSQQQPFSQGVAPAVESTPPAVPAQKGKPRGQNPEKKETKETTESSVNSVEELTEPEGAQEPSPEETEQETPESSTLY